MANYGKRNCVSQDKAVLDNQNLDGLAKKGLHEAIADTGTRDVDCKGDTDSQRNCYAKPKSFRTIPHVICTALQEHLE